MPGKSKKGGGLEVGSAYKMKGFSGFGNSPLKQDERPLTIDEKQASIDTIAAQRYHLSRGSDFRGRQRATDSDAATRIDFRQVDDHEKAVKRSEQRLIKGTISKEKSKKDKERKERKKKEKVTKTLKVLKTGVAGVGTAAAASAADIATKAKK